VEPSSGSSAAVATFLLIGFGIVAAVSHQDWSDGYSAGQFDMRSSLASQDDYRSRTEWLNRTDGPSYKCGMSDCPCSGDSRFLAGDV
jgi:hypothetical protein